MHRVRAASLGLPGPQPVLNQESPHCFACILPRKNFEKVCASSHIFKLTSKIFHDTFKMVVNGAISSAL